MAEEELVVGQEVERRLAGEGEDEQYLVKVNRTKTSLIVEEEYRKDK